MAGRKKSRSAVRRTYGSKKRSFRKKSYRKRQMKVKTRVTGRQMIPISLSHLKKKTEIKWNTYQAVNQLTPAAATMQLVWATIGVDSNVTNYMPMPQANASAAGVANPGAVSENGVVGRQWYYQWLDLSFSIRVVDNVTGSWDQCRVVIVKQKEVNLSPALFNTTYGGNFGLSTPILTKDYTVLYDKVYSFTTGFSTNLVSGIGGTNILTMLTPPKRLRFKMPFKYRAEWNINISSQWSPPFNTYVFVYSRNGFIRIYDIQLSAYYIQP